MSNISIILAILSISICILLSIIIYNAATRWITLLIVPFLCIAAYLGYNSAEDLKGSATSNIYKNEALFIAGTVTQKYIYVLVQPLSTDEPILMMLPYNDSLAQNIAEAAKNLCEGKPQATSGFPTNEAGQTDDRKDGTQSDVDSFQVYDFNANKGKLK
jgi:hypothetical protein